MSHTNNKGVAKDVSERYLEMIVAKKTINPISHYWIEEVVHQELQKARHDWLREEIGRLEAMKEDVVPKDLVLQKFGNYDSDRNDVLQTIIDRYHSELHQDNK